MSNIIDFRNASARRSCLPQESAEAFESRPYTRRGPNMHTFLFRSYDLIVESDEADLIRDIEFDLDKAQTKLRRLKEALQSYQERAAAHIQLLTAAEIKLTSAIAAALSTRGQA